MAVVACKAQTPGDYVAGCNATDPAVAEPACTTLLESGRLVTIDEANVFLSRGTARFRRGEWTAAIDDFNQAIERNSANPNSFHNRALAYAGTGNYDQAIRASIAPSR